MMRSFLFAKRAALLALTGFFLALQSAPTQAKVKVGLLLPTSGPYAVLGKDITQGFTLALKVSGMSGDVIILSEDTEAKPPVGVAKARKLVLQDKVDVIVGVVSSGVLGALRNFIDGAKVPLVVANAGNIHATGKDCSPWIVRVSFSNAQMNTPMGTWMVKQGIKRVYTMAPDYSAGRQMIEAFSKTFRAAGGTLVGSEFTPFRKTKDFGPYLTKAKAAKPDAIYAFYAGGGAIAFVKQYAAFGIKKDIPLYGAGFLTSSLYVNTQGSAAEGVTTALHYVPTLDTPGNRKFAAGFKKAYGRLPSEFSVQGYDAGRVLIEAVKAGAKTRAELAAALPKVNYVGPRGPLKIDPATNNVVQNIYIYRTVAGKKGLTQQVVDKIADVRDAPNGCKLK